MRLPSSAAGRAVRRAARRAALSSALFAACGAAACVPAARSRPVPTRTLRAAGVDAATVAALRPLIDTFVAQAQLPGRPAARLILVDPADSLAVFVVAPRDRLDSIACPMLCTGSNGTGLRIGARVGWLPVDPPRALGARRPRVLAVGPVAARLLDATARRVWAQDSSSAYAWLRTAIARDPTTPLPALRALARTLQADGWEDLGRDLLAHPRAGWDPAVLATLAALRTDDEYAYVGVPAEAARRLAVRAARAARH